jgi:serine phosphatase RsbU (regulator of sigma subunit)
MELQIAAAKVNKYATSESGDTLEVVERPAGGLSVVLADGQRSGRSAKRISNMVVRKVISLLAEGVRDGAAARAASDYLYHQRGGKVVATLNILSVDLVTNTMVVTRNNPAPVVFFKAGKLTCLDADSQPVGIYRDTRPVIYEMDLVNGLSVLVYTDGLTHAGDRYGKRMDINGSFEDLLTKQGSGPLQDVADALLSHALALDKGRPTDDISLVIVQVCDEAEDSIRRLTIRLPLS